MLGKLDDAPSKTRAQWAGEVWNAEIENVLYNIVAEWVLDKRVGVLNDMADQLGLLSAGSVVDAALQDTASVTVSTNHKTIVTHGVEDELGINRLEVVKTLLNDMVAVEVLNEAYNILLEGALDCFDLQNVSHQCVRRVTGHTCSRVEMNSIIF